MKIHFLMGPAGCGKTMNTIDISTAFAWGKPKEIATKRGPRLLLKAPVSTESDRFWHSHRSECVAAGVTLSEWPPGSGKWSFSWFREIPPEVVQARAISREESHAKDAEIDLPRPPGLDYMGFQRAGIRYALKRKGTLLGDEMGLGKTIQIIGVINSDPTIKRCLITVPAGLTVNWLHELRRWLVRDLSVGLVEGKIFPDSDIVIISHTMLVKHLERLDSVQWDLVAIDEAHRFKDARSQRSKVLFGYKPRRDESQDLRRGPVPARIKIAATGSPICNHPIELWPLIHWLDPQAWDNWWRFSSRYCGVKDNGFGKDFSGASNQEELHAKLRETVMIRRLKNDVLTELPSKVRSIVFLEPIKGLVEAEKAAIGELSDECVRAKVELEIAKAGDQIAYEAALERFKGSAKFSFQDLSKIRHESALKKVPAVVEYVREQLESVDKVLIFAHHRDVIEQITREFQDLGSIMIYGGMDAVDRQNAVTRFQNDPQCRVAVLSIIAAGVGLTLTAASNVYFAEEDWVPGNMSQAEDRAHRIGQKDTVMVQHLVMEGTIDCRIAEVAIAKQKVIDQILDTIPVEKRAEVQKDVDEPILMTKVPHVSSTRAELQKRALTITDEQARAIHDCIKALAGVCNGAVSWDGAGFSKIDVGIGHSLANAMWLTKPQAALGMKLVRKYHRQLGSAAQQLIEDIK